MFVCGGTVYAYAEDTASSAAAKTMDAVQNDFDIVSNMLSDNSDADVGIQVTSVTDSGAVLQWNTNSLCNSYSICKYNFITRKWDETASQSEGRLKLTGLTADTDYKYCVVDTVRNKMVGVCGFTTAMSKPKLSVIDRRSNKLTLSLQSVPVGYKAEIYRKSKGSKYKKIATVTGNKTFTDKKLKGATTYTYRAKIVSQNAKNKGKTVYSAAVSGKTLKKMGLPSVSGRTKTYAFYTAVTRRSSPQYKLLRSSECYTDPATGIRMVDDCYCVALGSYYGSKIGTKYKITFSNGNTIKVILCDQKANRHTDRKNQYALNNKDIVEFYVERSAMPKAIRNRGNYGLLSQFSGSIVSIEKYV